MPDLRLPHLPESLELPALIRRLNRYLGAPQGGAVTLTDVVIGTATFTSTLRFDPDNTHDVGDNTTPYRPRTVYGATSVVSPLGSFSSRVTTPLIGTTTASTDFTIASMQDVFVTGRDIDLSPNGSGPAFHGNLTGTIPGYVELNSTRGITLFDSGSFGITLSANAAIDILAGFDGTGNLGLSGAGGISTLDLQAAEARMSSQFDVNFNAYTGTNLLGMGNGVTAFTVASVTMSGTLAVVSEVRTPSLDTIGATDLTINRDNVLQLTLGSLAATFAGDLTVSGDNLNVRGVTYLWPAADAAGALQSDGVGNLSWAAIAPGSLSGFGANGGYLRSNGSAWVRVQGVAAADVTLGTFGAGAYTFPSTLGVSGALTGAGGVNLNAAVGTSGINWQDTSVNRVIMRLDSAATWSMNARDTGGVSIDNPISLTIASGGTLTIRRPISVIATSITIDGGAVASSLTVGGNTATSSVVLINGAAGTLRDLSFRTANSLRWLLRIDSTAESGGNAGSNLTWLVRDDAGAAIDTWVGVTRVAGGTIAFSAARPITGGTYNAQTISATASFTGTVAAVTHFSAPLLIGTTRVTSPLLGTTTAVDVVLARNSVTQLTLGSLTATFAGSLAITGALSGVTTLALSGQLTSTLATGTAPFSVASTTKVANLNVDLLDDQTGSYYQDSSNQNAGTLPSGRLTGSYTGITGVGTLTAGTWNASVISEAYGGTNQSTYALGDLLYASATNTLAKLAGNITTTPQYLRQTGDGVNSAAPVWDTLTAADVGAGTFPAGVFTFPDDLIVTDDLTVIDGPIIIGDGTGTGGQNLIMRVATARTASVYFQTVTSHRWTLTKTSATESGSNAGSGFEIQAYTDAGASIDSPLSITRASGGTIAFAAARPITGGTYNAQTISSAASFTGTVSVATELRTPQIDTVGATDLVLQRNNTTVLTIGSATVTNAQDFDVASGKVYKVNGTQVVGARGAAVTDATGGAVIDAEARTAINAIIARLEAHGLIAT